MRNIVKDDCTITVTALEEDMDFHGEYDLEVERSFERMVEEHGLWGWCTVEVELVAGNLKSTIHLGGCSYASEEDFIANSGYYDDLVSEGIDDLNTQARALFEMLR